MNIMFLISNAMWFLSLVYLAFVGIVKAKEKRRDVNITDFIIAVVYAVMIMAICYVIMTMVKVWVIGVPLNRVFDGLLC